MREFNLDLSSMLVNGLRSKDYIRLNKPYLSSMSGLKPSENGLVTENVDLEYLDPLEYNQYGNLFSGNYLSNNSRLTVGGDATKRISVGDRWRVVGYNNNWAATNSSIVITQKNEIDTRQVSDIEHFRGRFFFGGVNISYLNLPEQEDRFFQNNVVWCPVGMPFSFSPEDERLWRNNEFGFQEVRFSDIVLALRPLGDRLVLYGNKSLSFLAPQGNQFSHRTITTGYGVLNRNSIAGDESEHLFIDNFFNLVRINSNFQTEVLGFREYFLNSSDWYILFYDFEDGRRYYIANGNVCYIYDKYGLGSSKRMYKDISRDGKGIWEEINLSTSFKTNPFDFSSRDRKTLTALHTDSPGATVKVFADNKESPLVRCNSEGYARPQISGVEFIIEIQNLSSISRLTVGFQNVGKRFRRGPNIS